MPDARNNPIQQPLTFLRSAVVRDVVMPADPASPVGQPPRITVQFSTGAEVERSDWFSGEQWIESLEISEAAIDTTRLDSGAPFLRDHDPCTENVIGVVVPQSFRVEGGAAVVEIDLSRSPDDAGVVGKITDKIIRNVSVGYRVTEWQIDRAPGQVERRTATKWQPWEISAVAIPADPSAQIRSADGRAFEVPVDTQTPAPEPTPADVRAQVQRELLARQADIEIAGKAVGANPEIVRALVADPSVTVDAARAKLIADKVAAQAAEQVAAPVARVTVGCEARDFRREALIAAVALRANSPAVKDLSAGAVEQGNKLRKFSIVELARQCMADEGIDTRYMTAEEVIDGVFKRQSSSDFPYVLAAVIDKSLMGAYAQQPKAYTDIAIGTSVSNLRTRYPTILSGLVDLAVVAEGADYPVQALLESRESYSVAKRGQIIALTKEALIKDDLGAFARIPQAMADAAIRAENSVVFGLLNANAAMSDGVALFHASHANLIAAGGGAPSATTLSATDTLIALQTGKNAELLGLMGRVLVVPRAIYHTTAQLFSPRYVPTAATGVLAGNLADLKVVTHPVLDSGSATAWYLLCDPSQAPIIEYATPNDVASLSVAEEDGFTNDTKRYKVSHWFGAGVVDFRGAAKNPGA